MQPEQAPRLKEKVKSFFLEIAASLFVLLYLYTATSKLRFHEKFVSQLQEVEFLAPLAGFISWAVPLSEIAITLLLIVPRTRLIGLMAATILMSVFTVYVLCMLWFVPDLPCTCGGVIETMSWREHLAFNTSMTVVGGLASYAGARYNTRESSMVKEGV